MSLSKPVKVLRTYTDGQLEFFSEQLRSVLCRTDVADKKAIAVSCVGARRKGKSFLLNILLAFHEGGWELVGSSTREGFDSRDDAQSVTDGIDIWPEPLMFRVNGEEVVVVLVDTEGLDDASKKTNDACVVAELAMAFSTITLFNVTSNLDRMREMPVYTDRAKRLNDGQMLQHLTFVVRDWTSARQYAFGQEGGQQYLKDEVLKPHVDASFLKDFTQAGCWLLPHPGINVAEGHVPENGYADDAFFTRFMGVAEDFVKFVIPPDLSTARLRTCGELFEHIQACVRRVASLPVVHDMAEGNARARLEQVVSRLHDHYKRAMEAAIHEDKWIHLDNVSNAIAETQMAVFAQEASSVNVDIAEEYRARLEESMQDSFGVQSERCFAARKVQMIDHNARLLTEYDKVMTRKVKADPWTTMEVVNASVRTIVFALFDARVVSHAADKFAHYRELLDESLQLSFRTHTANCVNARKKQMSKHMAIMTEAFQQDVRQMLFRLSYKNVEKWSEMCKNFATQAWKSKYEKRCRVPPRVDYETLTSRFTNAIEAAENAQLKERRQHDKNNSLLNPERLKKLISELPGDAVETIAGMPESALKAVSIWDPSKAELKAFEVEAAEAHARYFDAVGHGWTFQKSKLMEMRYHFAMQLFYVPETAKEAAISAEDFLEQCLLDDDKKILDGLMEAFGKVLGDFSKLRVEPSQVCAMTENARFALPVYTATPFDDEWTEECKRNAQHIDHDMRMYTTWENFLDESNMPKAYLAFPNCGSYKKKGEKLNLVMKWSNAYSAKAIAGNVFDFTW